MIRNIVKTEQVSYLLKWTILCTVVGSISGIIIAIYTKFVMGATTMRLDYPALILGLPITGFVMSAVYDKVSRGRLLGNNVLISGIKGRREHVSLFMIPLVIMGTAWTHLCGASVGKEDMATELAGDIAFYTSRRLNLSFIDSQWIMISAIAAGFAGTFGTPIAATIFAMEVVNRGKMRLDGLYPAFITALVTKEATEYLGVHHLSFKISFPEMTLSVFLSVVLLSIFCGMVGHLFLWLILTVRHFGMKWLKTRANVSFATGLIVLALSIGTRTTEYLGLSTQMQQLAFNGGHLSPLAWLVKLIYCGFNIGGFYRGGATTPLFDIGSAFGVMMAPLLHLPQGFVAALCLVGVFAAATNAPIACFILGMELFQGDGATFFFMMAIFSFVTSGKFSFFVAQKMPQLDDEDVL